MIFIKTDLLKSNIKKLSGGFMLKKFLWLILIVFFLSSLVFAQDNNLSISKFVFCERVDSLNPVNVDTVFYNTIGKVCCFTQVKGAQDTTQISHLWYYNNEEMARVSLPVHSMSWRTWSSKQILPKWTGLWRVDIVNAAGNVIDSKSFTITE